MLYEIMLYSQDIKPEFDPSQVVSMISSREEIISKIPAYGENLLENLFDYLYHRPVVRIRNDTSSIYQCLDFEQETTFFEEFIREIEKEKVLENVSRMFDELTLKEKFFRGMDKTKLLNAISEMLNGFPPEQMRISEDELLERIKGVLVLEAVSGILNELTPEQREVFDEAVKRRPLFK